jgi:hypothetical protein
LRNLKEVGGKEGKKYEGRPEKSKGGSDKWLNLVQQELKLLQKMTTSEQVFRN